LIKKLKPKRCKGCGDSFIPQNGFVKCCSPSCAFVYARTERVRKAKQQAAKELREGRARLMTRSEHLNKAQEQFNRWIRMRDFDLPCISCQRNDPTTKKNAGHFLSVASHPEYRFHPDNCHLQCEHCNSWKSGAQQAYRPRLIDKIGLERVEALENGKYSPLKLQIPEILELKDKYRLLANALAKEHGV
jgi:hypothetical protein